ncbi:MAG: amidase family protein [Alphaproteobacteria bacterium]|nr:amidase family protein [Alphaproteobacteria bacterium]
MASADRTKPAFADATAIAEAVRHGEISATHLMKASIERARQDPHGALCHLDADMGMAAAVAFDDRHSASDTTARGAPFAGIPFLAKDLGNGAKGLPVHAGSGAMAKRVSPAAQDSALFRRFKNAGLMPFGVTGVPPFGLALTCEPDNGPPVRNPWNPDYSPGGSSGGAASAVASGIVAIAHATDAAGSIRVPAACCGLVGLKPSRGMTSNAPDFSNHLMGATGELVLARSVRDIRAALVSVCGHTSGPYGDITLSGVPVKGLRIAVVDTAQTPLGEEQAQAVRDTASLLEDHGHTIVGMDVAELDHLSSQASGIVRTILTVSLANWLETLGIANREVVALAAATAEEGRRLSAMELFVADGNAARIAHGCWQLFGGLDLILMPMLGAGTPKVGSMPVDRRNTNKHWKRMEEIAPRAALANIAGIPALSVPRGLDEHGMPLAVQLIGPIGADLLLLDVAQQIEAASPWAHRHPIAGAPM